jgi:signal transduction histidine kinase
MVPTETGQRSIVQVLFIGFTLVILLLLVGGLFGLRNIYEIQQSADSLAQEEVATTNLIAEVQSEQAALNAVFHKMARDPESIDRENILADLDTTDEHIKRIVDSTAGTPQEPMWRRLEAASQAFTLEARRLLAMDTIPIGLSRRMFNRHEEVLAHVATITRSNDQEKLTAQQQIVHHTQELIYRSALLFGACLLLALVCAFLTVKVTSDMLRKMEWQASELSRVSWHMLENQESAARRLSHELHDELGQSLTAIKANLVALEGPGQPNNVIPRERLQDCLHIVNETIANVRQISQLLRPTILDDFGLDAALRSLCERFHQRTGIEVEYQSDFHARLPDETETHLFRISQEALTNVARHSGATRVRVGLHAANERLQLMVVDNGRGLAKPDAPAAAPDPDPQAPRAGIGMVGMRARARSIGGELVLRSGVEFGPGLGLEVELPIVEQAKEADGTKPLEKDPHPVGR